MTPSLALFGTSADPPTLGHQALLEHLLSHYNRVATWASDNPLKRHGAPLQQRAQLLAALVEAIGDPRLEHVQALSSPWAITTLERARQRWPNTELVFVVGSDLLPQIPHWRQADQLLKGCRITVVPRGGWPVEANAMAALEQLGSRVDVLDVAVPATASSKLRQDPDPAQLPAALWPLLREHNLYGLAGTPTGDATARPESRR